MSFEIVALTAGAGLAESIWTLLKAVFSKPATETVIEFREAEPPIKTKGGGVGDSPETVIPQPPVRVRTRDSAGVSRLPRAVGVSPSYKFALIASVVLTVAAGLAHVAMASIWTTPTDMQRHAFEGMATAWQTGFGALIGLIGGKTLK